MCTDSPEGGLPYTAGDLRWELESAARSATHRHDVAWAGDGPYSMDGGAFVAVLVELDDQDAIAIGLTVVLEDGCWLSQECDEYGDNETWEMVRPPRRGEVSFSRIAGDETIEHTCKPRADGRYRRRAGAPTHARATSAISEAISPMVRSAVRRANLEASVGL